MEGADESAKFDAPVEGEGEERRATAKLRAKKRCQRYLERTGVSAAILRGIVSLYEDENKPNDPIRYLCEQWGFGIPDLEEVDSLQAEVIHLRDRYHALSEENEALKVLTDPKPTPEDELGLRLDAETQELLRKQEQELSKIQHREACILRAHQAAKAGAVKELKVKVCAPPITPTEVKSDADGESLGATPAEAGDGEIREAASTILVCSEDAFDEGQERVTGSGEEGDGSFTITILVEDTKNQPQHSCGLEIQTIPY